MSRCSFLMGGGEVAKYSEGILTTNVYTLLWIVHVYVSRYLIELICGVICTVCYRMFRLCVFFVWIPNYCLREFVWFGLMHVLNAHENKYKKEKNTILINTEDTVSIYSSMLWINVCSWKKSVLLIWCTLVICSFLSLCEEIFTLVAWK
jgi:hypothetical protein